MESLSDLKKEVQQDLEVDSLHLDRAAADNPRLHAKYLNLLLTFKNRYADAERKLRVVQRSRYDYWMGRAPTHVYKEEPKQLKILKTEATTYLDADAKIQEAREERDRLKHIVEYLEGVVQAIKGRGFDIKNMIEYRKFMAGE